MATAEAWRTELEQLTRSAWPGHLTQHSGLPGPRANLTLVQAAATVADADLVADLLRDGGEYTAMCAAAALGRRSDDPTCEAQARELAADERWRVREGVVLGLQLLADVTPGALSDIARRWSDDPGLLVQRAAVAAVCEPRLLRDADAAAGAVDVCRRCTEHLVALPAGQRARPDARTLRQALGYCWSIAVAADPGPGLAAFRSLPTQDRDVAWVVRQNAGKKRLAALLAEPA